MRWALVALALSGCMPVTEALPPGYPPQIGTVTADLDGARQRWDTYDYSIGAFDAAVQITSFDGPQFYLMGDPAGQPDSAKSRLLIKGNLTAPTQLGAMSKPVIEIIAGADFDGPRLTSVGSDVSVVLDTLEPMTGDGYGHVTGNFKATLCTATGQPARVNRAACQPFVGVFSSDLQISGG